ncbi:MAG: hypothetical protein MPJ24_11910 [Pirellulaceae bacterium]|nr:hypothetical protein [Pirellulaceae bacterium]
MRTPAKNSQPNGKLIFCEEQNDWYTAFAKERHFFHSNDPFWSRLQILRTSSISQCKEGLKQSPQSYLVLGWPSTNESDFLTSFCNLRFEISDAFITVCLPSSKRKVEPAIGQLGFDRIFRSRLDLPRLMSSIASYFHRKKFDFPSRGLTEGLFS